MKKLLTLLAVLLCLGAVSAFAHSALTIKPSEMKDGETKVLTDDGRTVSVKREGDTIHVTIAGADKSEKLTITRDGGGFKIDGGDGKARTWVYGVGPERFRNRIMIDGSTIDLDGDGPKLRMLPRKAAQNWYVCPNDKSMLRVPDDADEKKEFLCPVDGAKMEKKSGRGFAFFFDDSERNHEDM
jgi:hypothetical protein